MKGEGPCERIMIRPTMHRTVYQKVRKVGGNGEGAPDQIQDGRIIFPKESFHPWAIHWEEILETQRVHELFRLGGDLSSMIRSRPKGVVEVEVAGNDRFVIRREGDVNQGRKRGAVRGVVDVCDVENIV